MMCGVKTFIEVMRGKSLTPQEIADEIGISRKTASAILNTMGASKLVSDSGGKWSLTNKVVWMEIQDNKIEIVKKRIKSRYVRQYKYDRCVSSDMYYTLGVFVDLGILSVSEVETWEAEINDNKNTETSQRMD
jgi:hypothetical protein